MLSERRDDGFLLTTATGRLDHELLHEWIPGTYWATGRRDRAQRGDLEAAATRLAW